MDDPTGKQILPLLPDAVGHPALQAPAPSVSQAALQNPNVQLALQVLAANGIDLASLVLAAAPPKPKSAKDRGYTFQTYCTANNMDLEHDVYRPLGRQREDSFKKTEQSLAQLRREGVAMDPPKWESFWAWAKAHPRGYTAVDHQKYAYVRWMAYHGIEAPALHARGKWRYTEDHRIAVQEGRARVNEKHLRNGIFDLLKLLRGKPYKNELLNCQFHHAVAFCTLAAPRGREPWDLSIHAFQPQYRMVADFWQQKKADTRDVFIPEDWFWDGPGPTFRWFTETVRAQLLEKSGSDIDSYFVSSLGRPYSDEGYRGFMEEGMTRVLGYAIGPHALRRLGATLRFLFGWTIEEVAQHLGDDEATVREHYLDERLTKRVRRLNLNRQKDTAPPPLVPFWNIPKALGLDPALFKANQPVGRAVARAVA